VGTDADGLVVLGRGGGRSYILIDDQRPSHLLGEQEAKGVTVVQKWSLQTEGE
jgi:hypothetical protein